MRAWKEERSKRAGKLLKRINLTFELRQKLEKIFGRDLLIQIVTDLQDRPIAMIEEFRFTFINHGENNSKRIMLLDTCPRCWAETGTPINCLTDLGQLIEQYGTTLNLGCSDCVGLTDDDLKLTGSDTVHRQKRNE